MNNSTFKSDMEFWVVKGYRVLDNGNCHIEKNIAGPFKTKERAENAMAEWASRGETDMTVGELRFPKFDTW